MIIVRAELHEKSEGFAAHFLGQWPSRMKPGDRMLLGCSAQDIIQSIQDILSFHARSVLVFHELLAFCTPAKIGPRGCGIIEPLQRFELVHLILLQIGNPRVKLQEDTCDEGGPQRFVEGLRLAFFSLFPSSSRFVDARHNGFRSGDAEVSHVAGFDAEEVDGIFMPKYQALKLGNVRLQRLNVGTIIDRPLIVLRRSAPVSSPRRGLPSPFTTPLLTSAALVTLALVPGSGGFRLTLRLISHIDVAHTLSLCARWHEGVEETQFRLADLVQSHGKTVDGLDGAGAFLIQTA